MIRGLFSRFPRRTWGASSRKMGGPVAQGSPQPYEAYHGPSIYGNTPRPFGMGPGKYVMEGWEIPMGIAYVALAGMIVYMHVVENETPLEWARAEAIARKKVIESGGEVKFGKYYQYTEYRVNPEKPFEAEAVNFRDDNEPGP